MCAHDLNIGSRKDCLGSLKDYLGSLDKVNHGRYLLDLSRSFDSLFKENVISSIRCVVSANDSISGSLLDLLSVSKGLYGRSIHNSLM